MAESQGDDPESLLREAARGDSRATEALVPLVYEELRSLARRELAREKPGQTLQPTALVHEAYLRLVGDPEVRWKNRRHFFAAAARAMRRILVESARRKRRLKHGGGRARVELDERPSPAPFGEPREDLLALEEALERLESRDRRKSDVVHLRYFLGFTIEETAEALAVSPTTVKDDWLLARAWLRRELRPGPGESLVASGGGA